MSRCFRSSDAWVARRVIWAMAVAAACFIVAGTDALGAELEGVRRVDFGRVVKGQCERKGGSVPCAELDVDVKVARARKTASERRTIEVDKNLLSRLRSLVGRADNAALPGLTKVLLAGLSASADVVREGVGEALIAVAERKGWRCTSIPAGVRIPPDKRRLLQRVGCSFHAAAGRPIYITSGTRSTGEQADALDKKIRAGDKRLGIYKNRAAADELVSAWRGAAKAGKGHGGTRAALKQALDRQVKRGVYVSAHLKAGAVDIRSVGLSAKQKKAVRTAVRSVPGARIIEEKRPPHFHVELP